MADDSKIAIEPTIVPSTDGTQAIKEHSVAGLHSTPLARVWVYTWAVLTWLLVFSFCVLLLVVFTGSKGSGVEGGKAYKRSETVVTSFKCLEKVPWTGWQSVFDIYADPMAKAEVPAVPLGTAG